MVVIRLATRCGIARAVGLSVAALLVLLSGLTVADPASAQEPPIETPPTEDGLGDCMEGMKVDVLNGVSMHCPRTSPKREGSGGFETFIVLNCKAYEIRWEILDDAGRIVQGGNGRESHQRQVRRDRVG